MQCKRIILLLFASLLQQILQFEVCKWQQIALICDSKGSMGQQISNTRCHSATANHIALASVLVDHK